MSSSVWPMLEAERRSFIDYLKTVPEADWEKPSLCEGWTLRHVLVHSVAAAKNTPPSFIVDIVAAGFNFNKMTDKRLKREDHGTTAELIAQLEGLVSRKTPPARAMLGETIVHREDIRIPAGSPPHPYPAEHLIALADTYKKAGPPIRSKQRIKGFTLKATDHDWSTGEGPMVSGPLLSLVLAMTGRPAGLAGLSGEGLEAFSQQIRTVGRA